MASLQWAWTKCIMIWWRDPLTQVLVCRGTWHQTLQKQWIQRPAHHGVNGFICVPYRMLIYSTSTSVSVLQAIVNFYLNSQWCHKPWFLSLCLSSYDFESLRIFNIEILSQLLELHNCIPYSSYKYRDVIFSLTLSRCKIIYIVRI